jgi:uncharacterized protein
MSLPCPICHEPAKPRAENPCFPFCGSRCKTVDLGAWLGEAYRVPVQNLDEDDIRELEAGLGESQAQGAHLIGGDGRKEHDA